MKPPSGPEARGQSVRQALLAALSATPKDIHELSAAVGVGEKDLLRHLEHVQRSAKREGSRVRVEPSQCLGCGFVFQERARMAKPSRCPSCRSERITPPRYSLG